MRAAGRVDLSRRAIVAVVAGALLLHVAALWWALQQMRVTEGGAAAPQAPAMFAFFVRPAQREPMPIEPALRVQGRATAVAMPVAPRVQAVAAASPAVAMPIAAEPRINASAAIATSIARATEPLPAPAMATPRVAPPEEIAVARPDHGQCPPPAYPMLLREQGIEGVVTLRVRVDAFGRAAEVHLLEPSGWRLFDEAALQQVRACRFVPARRGGEALASWVEFPVRFALNG